MRKMTIIKFFGNKGESYVKNTASGEFYKIIQYTALYWDGEFNHAPIVFNKNEPERVVVVMNKKHTKAFAGYRNSVISTYETEVPEKFTLAKDGVFIAVWLDEVVQSANFIQIKACEKGYSHIMAYTCAPNGYDIENVKMLVHMFKGCAEAIPTWNMIQDDVKQRMFMLTDTPEIEKE